MLCPVSCYDRDEQVSGGKMEEKEKQNTVHNDERQNQRLKGSEKHPDLTGQ